MPISSEFRTLFDDMLTKYKQSGSSMFYNRKEPDREAIISLLEDFKTICEGPETEKCYDQSIIDALNSKFITYGPANREALELWMTFVSRYNTAKGIVTSIDKVHINIKPDNETAVETLQFEFQSALVSMTTTLNLSQQTQLQMTEKLTKRIETLAAENKRLTTQVAQLEQKIHNQEHLQMLNPQILQAQGLLTVLFELTKTSNEKSSTSPASTTTAVTSEPTTGTPKVNTSPTEVTTTAKPLDQPKPSTPLRTASTPTLPVATPPAPKKLPGKEVVAANPSSLFATLPTSPSTKTNPPSKKYDLLTELNEALEAMKKKTNQKNTSTDNDTEKKSTVQTATTPSC